MLIGGVTPSTLTSPLLSAETFSQMTRMETAMRGLTKPLCSIFPLKGRVALVSVAVPRSPIEVSDPFLAPPKSLRWMRVTEAAIHAGMKV